MTVICPQRQGLRVSEDPWHEQSGESMARDLIVWRRHDRADSWSGSRRPAVATGRTRTASGCRRPLTRRRWSSCARCWARPSGRAHLYPFAMSSWAIMPPPSVSDRRDPLALSPAPWPPRTMRVLSLFGLRHLRPKFSPQVLLRTLCCMLPHRLLHAQHNELLGGPGADDGEVNGREALDVPCAGRHFCRRAARHRGCHGGRKCAC